ncbi:MAG TPA: DUF423 domain-containing protein [Oceanospirillales bacterium]|nr:DUF423 domain-containing protein [Oceanospirillales bacterium]
MTAVALAALGGHILHIEKGSVNYLLFNNAVTYQLLHAILILGLSAYKQRNFWIRSAIFSMLFGVLLFSGGLYVLVIVGKTAFSWITPVGGSLLILGWLNLSIAGFQKFFNTDK